MVTWRHLSSWPVWESDGVQQVLQDLQVLNNLPSVLPWCLWSALQTSTAITRGQEKEGALSCPLTFSPIGFTWIFDYGVAVPVCRLPYLCATALSFEVGNSDSSGYPGDLREQEGAIQNVPIASSLSFTSPQGCALAVWQILNIHFSFYSTGDLSQPWTITLC